MTSPTASEPLFIIWDPRDGDPRREESGEFISNGILGRLTEGNAYLTAYPTYPDARRPVDLEVGGCIRGVRWQLSGQSGYYDIYRVR